MEHPPPDEKPVDRARQLADYLANSYPAKTWIVFMVMLVLAVTLADLVALFNRMLP